MAGQEHCFVCYIFTYHVVYDNIILYSTEAVSLFSLIAGQLLNIYVDMEFVCITLVTTI